MIPFSVAYLSRRTVIAPAIAGAGVAPVLLVTFLSYTATKTFADLPVHAVLEVAGGGMALGVAALLDLRTRYGGLASRTTSVAAALAWMGPMDIVHGVLPFGPAWSWTRTVRPSAEVAWLPGSWCTDACAFRGSWCL